MNTFPYYFYKIYLSFLYLQSIAAAIAFFYSTALQLPHQLLILATFGTIGTFSFWMVEWNEYAKAAKEKATIKINDTVK